jgi:hypothetical protein
MLTLIGSSTGKGEHLAAIHPSPIERAVVVHGATNKHLVVIFTYLSNGLPLLVPVVHVG